MWRCQAEKQQAGCLYWTLSCCSHLILQLILSVHLMLGDIEVVSGVVVDRLCEAERDNIQDRVFQ